MIAIKINNMACSGCAKSVLGVLHQAAPGAGVRVNLELREVEVEAIDATPIIAALRASRWEAATTA